MLLMNYFKEYPDGSDKLISLLQKFSALKKEQIIIFFIQSDKTYNKERVEDLIDKLIEMDEVMEDNGIIALPHSDENEDIIDAFWVLLHSLNNKTKFDQAEYPSTILFTNNKEVNEIIVMDNDSQIKMDYLSKRKARDNDCRYNFLFTSGTIDNFDDELFEGINITLITMEEGKDTPKLVYHEVTNE